MWKYSATDNIYSTKNYGLNNWWQGINEPSILPHIMANGMEYKFMDKNAEAVIKTQRYKLNTYTKKFLIMLMN